jgi:hypothetical protein
METTVMHDVASSLSPPAPAISPVEAYAIIRHQIEHEDNLMGQRITWFVTSQSFLLSAYAILLNGIQLSSKINMKDPREALLVILPIIAIITSLIILPAIYGAMLAMRRLRDIFHKSHGDASQYGLPPLHGARLTQILGHLAPAMLPLLFFCVWLFVILGLTHRM